MDGMSNIRNEIEQRLGVFARPGAKTTFGSKRTTAGALRKQLKAQGMTDAADLEWHGISASDPDSTPYWLHEDGSMEKIKASPNERADLQTQIANLKKRMKEIAKSLRASRPGAKAMMGKYWVEDGQSNVKQPVKSMREGIQLVSGMQNGVLRYADHGMTSILAYGRGSGGASLTEDGKLHQKHASSRPGAKDTYAAVDSRTELMLRTWVRNNFPKASNADFNKILAKMLKQYGKDAKGYTYGGGFSAVARDAGLMSRPGAKAMMDKSAALAIVGKAIDSVPAGPQRDALQKALIDYHYNTQARNRLLKQGNLTDATRFDVEAGRAVQIAVRVWDRMGKPAAELRGFTQNLERAAEFSRPGAKSRNAISRNWNPSLKTKQDAREIANDLEASLGFHVWAEDGIVFVDSANYERAAKARKQQTGMGYNPRIKLMPFGKTNNAIREGEKISAGEDDALSRKIRKLMDEGKPQDQAVAIALDMKRRGEL